MSELNVSELIQQIAGRNYKTETRYSDVLNACQQTAAAVIELIRERMPPVPIDEDSDDLEWLGKRTYRSEILKLLDTIK